jgi:hypothetical protein
MSFQDLVLDLVEEEWDSDENEAGFKKIYYSRIYFHTNHKKRKRSILKRKDQV